MRSRLHSEYWPPRGGRGGAVQLSRVRLEEQRGGARAPAMTDVIVVGAGPAGTVAAFVLARAGARVLLIDRARFPRPKLCGDTLNPGTLALLRRLQLAAPIEAVGLGIDGMLVTGAGVRVVGRYPTGVHGRSLTRFDLDGRLVDQCTAAGVDFLDGTRVQAA